MRSSFLIAATAVALLLTLSPNASAQDTLEQKLEAALSADSRPDGHKERDRNRRPIDTLKFFQLKDDMKVVELLPGSGWYTRILAPVLREKGELHVGIGTSRVEKLKSEEGFDKINVLDFDIDFDRSGPFGTNNVTPFSLPVKRVDLALTFRNMHNFTPEARKIVNEAVFKSLKRGGLYGVVDHTQRHMEPMTRESRRRIDPMVVVKEVLDAGFELVDFSDLHYKPDDELRYEVGRKSVTGNTDRFTILFRKP
ncbi:MAG: class I SAM-dependent methyltransferase [Gammaproteobacteria bacterium]